MSIEHPAQEPTTALLLLRSIPTITVLRLIIGFLAPEQASGQSAYYSSCSTATIAVACI